MLALRDYQVDLVAHARAQLRAGCRRLLIQAPTGSGKTCLVAHMLARAAEKGKRAWFICHRRELVQQAVSTFVEAADLHVGIIAAGYPSDPSAPVQVCSVASLPKRLAKVASPDLVVWDECHRIASKSWSSIASALPNAVQVGLTATPARLDGRGLGAHFDRLICGPSTADLIAAGWLAPYRLFAPALFDASGLHTVAGDYNKKETATAMAASTVVGDAVGTYQRHGQGGRALVFAWSLDASRTIAAAFVAAGIPAAHVDGETPDRDRAAAMRRFRMGELRVMTNVELFGEGLDVPSVDAVFLLRPTASLGLYLQQCGRGLRPAAGKECRIFDHAGNYTRHGLPDDPREWSLEGTTGRPRHALAPVKRCPACFAVAPASARECPYCHEPYAVAPRKVVQLAGELQETDLSALRANVREKEQACRTLDDWHALARELHYAPGWAWYRWSHRQGTLRKGSHEAGH